MIGKSDIAAIVDEYDRLKLRIGMTASHSALDICDGAIEEGFPHRCVLQRRSSQDLCKLLQNPSQFVGKGSSRHGR